MGSRNELWCCLVAIAPFREETFLAEIITRLKRVCAMLSVNGSLMMENYGFAQVNLT
ncbi:hypothetical protein [Calothrix sp. NIES-3974]|uniref:hypothetical protein n=1 Tax=Calothrix sp. NIES-3974 TaxID=2005462 RepID=UPI0012FD5286|nr:hypothetical protein [Calothrix sp. NIES-3974]